MKPRLMYYKNGAQALIEVAILGAIVLVFASFVVAIIMRYVFEQRVMVKNFRMAAKFAREIGSSGEVLTHLLVEHKKIPSLMSTFFSSPSEFMDSIGLIWSWNMYHSEEDKDYVRSVQLMRVVIDGKSLSEAGNISSLRTINLSEILPNDIVELGEDFLDEFFVIESDPAMDTLDTLNSVLGKLKPILGGRDPIILEIRSIMRLINELDEESEVEREWEDIEDAVIRRLETLLAEIRAWNPGGDEEEGTKEDVITLLEELIDYLRRRLWKGDVEFGATFRPEFIERDNRDITVEFSPKRGSAQISSGFVVERIFPTTYGNWTVNWESPEETYEWK